MHPKSWTLLEVHIFLWVKKEKNKKVIVQNSKFVL